MRKASRKNKEAIKHFQLSPTPTPTPTPTHQHEPLEGLVGAVVDDLHARQAGVAVKHLHRRISTCSTSRVRKGGGGEDEGEGG